MLIILKVNENENDKLPPVFLHTLQMQQQSFIRPAKVSNSITFKYIKIFYTELNLLSKKSSLNFKKRASFS